MTGKNLNVSCVLQWLLIAVLTSLCLSACNGIEKRPSVVTLERQIVVMPDPADEDLMVLEYCSEVVEITWGDAKNASDHYRRCKDNLERQRDDLVTFIRELYRFLKNAKGTVETPLDTE